MRHLQTRRNQTDDYVAKVSRAFGHQTVRDTGSGTPLDDGGGVVLCLSIEVREEFFVVRMVFEDHTNVLVTWLSSHELDVVELKEVVGLLFADG